MVNNKYKIGNFVYQIISQVDYEEEYPVTMFMTDENPDFTVYVELVDSLPQKIDNPIYDAHEKVCTEIGDELCCYFRNTDSFGKNNFIYAKKSMVYGSKECTISVVESMKRKICSHVIILFMCMEEITAENGCFIFHSSYIDCNGKAVIFTGPCGMGKSTQADLWNKYRKTPIINGDKTLFYVENGTVMAGGLPFSGSSQYCENVNLPIGAIIKLGQSDENRCEMLTGFDAFNAVLSSCYPVTYSKHLIGRQIDLAEMISQKVPVFKFDCRKDESAVDYLEENLCQILQNQ